MLYEKSSHFPKTEPAGGPMAKVVEKQPRNSENAQSWRSSQDAQLTAVRAGAQKLGICWKHDLHRCLGVNISSNGTLGAEEYKVAESWDNLY